MITEKIIYEAECCNCKRRFINDYAHVVNSILSKDKLIQDLKSDGWQITTTKGQAGGEIENVYCPECRDENQ